VNGHDSPAFVRTSLLEYQNLLTESSELQEVS